MRIGVLIAGGSPRQRADAVCHADHSGLDLVWLAADRERPAASLVAATAAAARTRAVRVGVEVPLGDTHPLHVAEEIAVADQVLQGRLVPTLTPSRGAEPDFAEAVRLVFAAAGPRPFRHPGPRWPTPANLRAHGDVPAEVRVLPTRPHAPAAVWIDGDPAVAAHFATPFFGRAPGPVRADADPDAAVMVRAVRAAAQAGADTVLFRLPSEAGHRESRDMITTLARDVRPRTQLAQLPPGLDEFWERATREEFHV
ncbi:LLM class flavin-dependent oxidoreductase [Amycolatopsis sp. K13G38]|uniref:LLM class flavin-dependent oxidoreductase n=1 Tax=Amycolatopsis acididurans TaxID=2724524 RepID=A0ABX1JET9_9PSEU|nr:LLM class flavin-dependent oxidoreductase [Amycolatopsis acididurans]NKQ57230.1 LLM class flavin-dependent oxidoreductase [Amycolatopsis acididurans]